MNDAIQVERLEKSYGDVAAVRGIDLTVRQGELFGVIGPDGAGKTSLFRILATLLIPDKGRARVLGLDAVHDYRKIRLKIGYMPGRFSLYPDLTVEENLRFFATVFGTTPEANRDIIDYIYKQIEPFKDRRAAQLSGGMKQKLALSCALVHRPEVLILDEPTTGVDAVSRKEFWEMLQMLKTQGITIVVSTPYMDEASLCDRVALMQSGQLMDTDEPARIPKRFSLPLFAVQSRRVHDLLTVLRAYDACDMAYPFGESVHFVDRRDAADPEGLRLYLAQHSFDDAKVTIVQPTIEDTFIFLMKRHGHSDTN
jgi:ABC-type multidrug transport system ATPase subunit